MIFIHINPVYHKLKFRKSGLISCRISPKFLSDAEVEFKVVGLPREFYTKFNSLSIRINYDKTIINRNICVICGNKKKMNSSRCYTLIGYYFKFLMYCKTQCYRY